jgi:hypothetical protein
VSRIFEENQQSAIQSKIEHHFGKDSKQTVIPQQAGG